MVRLIPAHVRRLWLPALLGALTLLAAAQPLLPRAAAERPPAPPAFPGWPTHLEGRPLRALPLSDREAAFGRDFPGALGRFTDGRREVILRWVWEPTRRLHPAADCFRAIGYTVRDAALPVTAASGATVGAGAAGRPGTAGCFLAERDGTRLRVCESLTGSAGGSWTDVSAWYWDALLGRSAGPWWAYTVAERLPPGAD